ncbi:FadR/GntR family transcriptional regulator [Demequina sp.]|uniref:FadR/GntR family transcriptional regulator n=1 Tax=Demequina sp. TaxID=2050685 RepID=UPI003A8479CB
MNPGAPAEATPSLSQTDTVIHRIKAMILEGSLGPGARLPVEKDLAAQLGVSRGSLREGVRALAHMGVLETRQGDGTYVTSLEAGRLLSPLGFLADLPTPGNAAHLLGVRRALEAESVSLAATHISADALAALAHTLDKGDAAGDDADLDAFLDADTEFHLHIAQASGNPALAALVGSLLGSTERARVVRAMHDRGAVAATQAEHRAILAELTRRDPQRARVRMEAHLMGVEEFARDHDLDAASQ